MKALKLALETNKALGMDMFPGQVVADSIDQDMVVHPQEQQIDRLDFTRDIKREVLNGVQRACNIQGQEEQDDHEACQASKVAKAAAAGRAGRPKKLMSELKSDVVKIIRDRCTHLTDSMDTLNRSVTESEQEAVRQLKAIPHDLAAILVSTKVEVKATTAKILEIHDQVRAKNIDDLVSITGDTQPKLEDIKKQIVDLSKPAFNTHLVSGNKSVASFKSAVKKAVKEAGKVTKKGAIVGEIPPLPKKLLEIVHAAALDMCNVEETSSLIGHARDRAYIVLDQTVKVKTPLEKIKALPATSRWLTKEIEKNKGDLTYAMAAHKPAVAKQVMVTLREKMPSFLTVDMALPADQEVLRDDIFGAQGWAQHEFHMNTCATPYGLPEIRMLLTGAYVVAGVKLDKLKGTTLKEKVDNTLTEKGFRSFLEAAGVEGSGFWAIHDIPYSSIFLPSSHLIVTCGLHSDNKDAKGCDGMRWSWLQHKDPSALAEAKQRVEDVMQAYPELNSDEYVDWLTCIERYLIPAAAPA